MKRELIIECENIYENEDVELRSIAFNNIIANIISVQIDQLSQ